MNYKGQDVRNVFHLRTPEDANSVARLANNKNAVIVGTSFVGERDDRHAVDVNSHMSNFYKGFTKATLSLKGCSLWNLCIYSSTVICSTSMCE